MVALSLNYWRGWYYFLYTDSRRPNIWIIGWGLDVTTAIAYYSAPAVDGRPVITGWSWVRNEGREGRDPAFGCRSCSPEVRVVGV